LDGIEQPNGAKATTPGPVTRWVSKVFAVALVLLVACALLILVRPWWQLHHVREVASTADRIVIDESSFKVQMRANVVRQTGEAPPEPAAVVLDGQDEVDELMSRLSFRPALPAVCGCGGDTAISLYKGDELRITLTVFHGDEVSWGDSAWTERSPLTRRSASRLRGWLQEKYWSVNPWLKPE